MITRNPHNAYARNEPGPVLPMTTPEPTNSPAPITPPIAIILSWRSLSPFLSAGPPLIACPREERMSPALNATDRVVRHLPMPRFPTQSACSLLSRQPPCSACVIYVVGPAVPTAQSRIVEGTSLRITQLHALCETHCGNDDVI